MVCFISQGEEPQVSATSNTRQKWVGVQNQHAGLNLGFQVNPESVLSDTQVNFLLQADSWSPAATLRETHGEFAPLGHSQV